MRMLPVALIYLLLLAWAAVAGFPRLGCLLLHTSAGEDHRLHAALGMLVWVATLGVLARASLARPSTGRGALADLARQFSKNQAAMFGLHLAILLALLALMTPLLAPFEPTQQNVGDRLGSPTLEHLFGTDGYGRDVFSRCLYGAKVSLTIGFVAVSISATLGTLVGACAGFFGGVVDRAAMWFVDLLLSLPRLVLLLAVVGILRVSSEVRFGVLIVVLGATGWMGVARIVRAQILSLRERDFVAAAQALGLPAWRILLGHLVPNALAPVIVYTSLALGATILTEAALSFLGLGIAPPTPSWGNIVTEGKDVAVSAPWVAVFPGLLIVAAVMSFNLLGDGLRDALDPKLRGRS